MTAKATGMVKGVLSWRKVSLTIKVLEEEGSGLMPLTGWPGANFARSKEYYAFFKAPVEIKEISAPVSAHAPIGRLLPSDTKLYWRGERLGGVASTA